MSTKPDLSLPSKAPVEHYRKQSLDGLPVALYTLIDLPDAELQNIQTICESETAEYGDLEPGDNVRLAPRSRFVGEPLRAVCDYHLELGAQGVYDPIYFLVIVDKDWEKKGILLVTLDSRDDERNVDSLWLKASESGLTVVNLQIVNTDWQEQKFNYARDDDDAENEAGNDGSAGDGGDDDDGRSSDSGPEFPKKIPYPYHSPLYVLDSVDATKLIQEHLEPAASLKKNPFEDYAIRLQASLTPKVKTVDTKSLTTPDPEITADLVAQACTLHPVRCRKNRFLNKTYLMVCDTVNPAEYGLLIVKLSWDGVTANRSKAELRAIGAAAPRDTQRMPCVVYDGFQQRFCGFGNSARIWRPDHPLVAVFQLRAAGRDIGASWKLLDSRAGRRKDGDACLLYAPERFSRPDILVVKWTFDEAVRRFPWFCRMHRWEENLTKTYFICVDNEKFEQEGVLLVRVDWDGDVHRSDEELLALQLKDKVTTVRVPIKEAFGMIEKAVKGVETSGLSPELVAFFSAAGGSS